MLLQVLPTAAIYLVYQVSPAGVLFCSVGFAKDVELLEKIQKFGLKVSLEDWSSDYTSLLSSANIHPLSMR